MAVIRQQNWLGQQRVDAPHLRALESAVANDFDVIAGDILAGGGAYVTHGFEVLTLDTGIPANTLMVRVAGATMLHPEASESGTIFKVPADRADETLEASNGRVTGSFTSSSTNYVGIDLRRTADATTADLVQFLDPDTKEEKPKAVPLARTLDYVFVISTQDFSTTPGVAPICKVVTDAGNNVVSIVDARNFLGRLGKGGAVPDTLYAYPWPGGRSEAGDSSDFTTGDKAISSVKDWMDAVMTRTWEIGGGEHWYSPTADRNVRMIRLGSATVFPSTGDWFEWTGGHLHWRGVAIVFDNSAGYINEIKDQATNSTGLTDLADGECIYVDIDRSQNLTGSNALVATKVALTSLGTPVVPGSRYVIAERYGNYIYTRDGQFFVGVTQPVATTVAVGTVRLHATPGAPSTPTVVAIDANGGFIVTETAGAFNPAIRGNGAAAVGAAHAGRGVNGTGGAAVTGFAGLGGIFTGGAVSNQAGTPGRGLEVYGGASTGNGAGAFGLVAVGGGNATNTGAGGGGVAGNGYPGGASMQAGDGVWGSGGNNTSYLAGHGLRGYGGNVTSGTAGLGAILEGGDASAGVGASALLATPGTSAAGSVGAIGIVTTGGAATSVQAGHSLFGTGGAATSGTGGGGADLVGGAATTGTGGFGVRATGGAAGVGGTAGGIGGIFVGGSPTTGIGGTGIDVSAGAGSSGGVAAKFKKSATGNLGVTSRLGQAVEIHKTGTSNVDPALVFYSTNGQAMNQFGQMGRQTGRISTFHDDWFESVATNPRWTTGATSGAASLAINSATSGYAGNYLSLQAVRGAGVDQYYYLRSSLLNFPHPTANTSLYFSAEFVIGTNVAADANTVIWCGFTSADTTAAADPTGAGVNTIAFRFHGTTDNNWHTYVRGNGVGANVANDTSIDPVAAGYPAQVLRIEMHGSATELGAATVRFYIDGASVGSYTDSLPVGPMYMFVTSGAITGNSTHTVYVGNVDASWNVMPLTVR